MGAPAGRDVRAVGAVFPATSFDEGDVVKRVRIPSRKWLFGGGAAALLVIAVVAGTYSQAQKGGLVTPANPYDKVFESYTKVVSTTDGKAPMYEIWTDKKKG